MCRRLTMKMSCMIESHDENTRNTRDEKAPVTRAMNKFT